MASNTIPLRFVLTVIATASLAVAQASPSGEAHVFSAGKLLTNDSIVRLTQADVSQETILHVVNSQPGSYALGVEDIIALKQAGVSDRVLDAMLDRSVLGCGPAMTVPMELFVSPSSAGNGNGIGQPPSQPAPTPHSGSSKSVGSTGANSTIQGTQAPVYHYGTGPRKAPQNAQ